MNTRKLENTFFLVFEELIKTFSDDKNLKSDHEEKGFSKDFISLLVLNGSNNKSLEQTAASAERADPIVDPRLDRKFQDFMSTLEVTRFNHGIIPYDRITESVFANTPVEILNKFTADLHKRGDIHFLSSEVEEPEEEEKVVADIDIEETNVEKLFYKILRHIDLALVQKASFSRINTGEIENLKTDYQELNERYNKLKEDAENQYKSMLTQFITILGIFAAIMMGAFGAIQGFTSLFANAHTLSIGKIFIISSIGASSVILILFFLLNGIAKLTGRSLWSTKKENGTLIEKHPSLVIVHGILIFTSLIGASLQLSNVHINWAPKEGAWWLLPFMYLLIAWLFYRNFKWEWFQKIKRILVKEKNT